MDGGIVEFHALSDADRARAKHDDLFLVRKAAFLPDLLRLQQIQISGIEIRDIFPGMERIDHPEDRRDALFFPPAVNCGLVHLPNLRDIPIGKAHGLGSDQSLSIPGLGAEQRFHLHDLPQTFKKDIGDHRHAVELIDPMPAPQQFRDGKDAVVTRLTDVFEQLLVREAVKAGTVYVANAGLKGTDRLEKALGKRAPDPHDLAGGFHLRAKRVRGGREFVKRKSREFRDDIVQ